MSSVEGSACGLWGLVFVNSTIYTFFAFSFFRLRTALGVPAFIPRRATLVGRKPAAL